MRTSVSLRAIPSNLSGLQAGRAMAAILIVSTPDLAYLALLAGAVASGLAFRLWVLVRLGRPPLSRQVRLA